MSAKKDSMPSSKIPLRSSAICVFCGSGNHDLCYREKTSSDYDQFDLCGCYDKYHE